MDSVVRCLISSIRRILERNHITVLQFDCSTVDNGLSISSALPSLEI